MLYNKFVKTLSNIKILEFKSCLFKVKIFKPKNIILTNYRKRLKLAENTALNGKFTALNDDFTVS